MSPLLVLRSGEVRETARGLVPDNEKQITPERGRVRAEWPDVYDAHILLTIKPSET